MRQRRPLVGFSVRAFLLVSGFVIVSVSLSISARAGNIDTPAADAVSSCLHMASPVGLDARSTTRPAADANGTAAAWFHGSGEFCLAADRCNVIDTVAASSLLTLGVRLQI